MYLTDLLEPDPVCEQQVEEISFFTGVEVAYADLVHGLWHVTFNAKRNGGVIFIDDAIAALRCEIHDVFSV